MKALNLGCGPRLFPEPWVNADALDHIGADILMDINHTPWPWPTDTFDQLFANHALEHGLYKAAMMAEIWRICKPGAFVEINVPIATWEGFHEDPSHVSHWIPTSLTAFVQGEGSHTALGYKHIEFRLGSYLLRAGWELHWELYVVKPGREDIAEPPVAVPEV